MKRHWRHRKTGNPYTVIALARMEADETPVVVYGRMDLALAPTWVRPRAEFQRKFEPMTPEEVPFVVEDAGGHKVTVHEHCDIRTTSHLIRPTPDQARALARGLWQAADAAEGRDDD